MVLSEGSQQIGPKYALRTLVRPAYSRPRPQIVHVPVYAKLASPIRSLWQSRTRSCMTYAYAPRTLVRPAYRGGSSPYKRDARVPKKGLHFSPLLCVLASFSVPVLTRSPGHFAQVPKVVFTPENPEEIRFPRRNSAWFPSRFLQTFR